MNTPTDGENISRILERAGTQSSKGIRIEEDSMPFEVLVVSPQRSVIDVAVSALARCPRSITGVQSYRDALYVLVNKHIAVLLCDDNLPDGSWKDLLGQIAMMPEPPRLVLMAETSDRALCAEAINLGFHDVCRNRVKRRWRRRACCTQARRRIARLLVARFKFGRWVRHRSV